MKRVFKVFDFKECVQLKDQANWLNVKIARYQTMKLLKILTAILMTMSIMFFYQNCSSSLDSLGTNNERSQLDVGLVEDNSNNEVKNNTTHNMGAVEASDKKEKLGILNRTCNWIICAKPSTIKVLS